jgi:membrane associated rhomboid family serine protease
MLFPFQADVELKRWPILTLIVCALCIWVFARQVSSAHAYQSALNRYCNQEITRDERLVLRYLDDAPAHYCTVLLELRAAPDRTAAIRELADKSRTASFYKDRADSIAYVENTLTDSLSRFDRAVPNQLTERLHFDPNHPTFASMVTAAFSHGSWWHLISNLIFFFAFAASTEVITGYAFFTFFIVVSAVGTHLAYRYSVAGIVDAPPTVGLSGVVMAMMAFLATIMPTLRIRCLLWILIFFRIFRIPALFIAALYIVENLVDYANRDPTSNINYIAHISGAAIGVLTGLIYRVRREEFLRELRQEL